jgi:hypothetical protein
MLGLGSFAACSHGGSSGSGGAATTTTIMMMGNCDAGASATDCAACSTYSDCLDCEFNLHPSGENDFLAISLCTECTACYKACSGIVFVDAGLCSPPSTTDPCDVGGVSNAACMQCSQCALLDGGSCSSTLNTCLANSDCLALVAEEPGCPAN